MARRRRQRLARKPREPRGPSARYEKALSALTSQCVAVARRQITPHIERAAARADADVVTPALEIDIEALRIALFELVREGRITPIVADFLRRVSSWNGEEIRRVLGIDLPLDLGLEAALAEARSANVALIRSIPGDMLGEVERTIALAQNSGMRVETLAKRLEDRYRIAGSRARLIARDQTLKVNSDLTRIRYRNAGISQYVWSTSGDERVRPMHRDLNGRTFSLDAPPVTNENGDRNHPGRDYQCRCTQRAVLS